MFRTLVLLVKLCSMVSSKVITLDLDPDTISDESKLSINDVPYVVSIHNTIADDDKEKVCTGSLIDSHWILTSAHCFDGGKITKTMIKFGINDYNLKTANNVKSRKIFIHPDYNNRSLINDLALMNVRLPRWYVNKIAYIMADEDGLKWHQEILEERKCLAIGYGKINYNDSFLYLKKLTVRYDPQGCGCFITNRELLCGSPVTSVSGVCFDDYGGPLICNGLLVGVSNQLLQCEDESNDCAGETYHRYTNLCAYFKWISEYVDLFSDVCHGYEGLLSSTHRAKPTIDIILMFVLM
uniref:Putative trypsin-like serine protease n=1 Tax=Panstrongylus lignarius TaxID=156445 RepID=A0A224XUV7_9HEMI